ncbi:MAG: DUF4258 domain-containing protein [Armatimonadetes bacterium]|nr:DUF4258 domain-containing protein [Armatimonadota bacterium]
MQQDAIRAAVAAARWVMTHHALQQSGSRRMGSGEIAHALAGCEVLEDYPNDPRGESALVLGYTAAHRPIHAVCTFDPSGSLVIITVYDPGMPWWLDERTRAPGGGTP